MAAQFHPYQALGLTRMATASEIKKAYRKLAVKYHPERNPNNVTTTEKFEEVSHAYEILRNPQTRSAYERLGNDALPAHFRDPLEIFREAFHAADTGSGNRVETGTIFEHFLVSIARMNGGLN